MEEPEPTSPVNIRRDTRAYKAGVKAYQQGKPATPPERAAHDKKIEWYTGWYDTRTAETLSKVLERNNLSWP